MKIEALFQSFAAKKVLVVGDVMIDSYVKGSVTRVSPEAPVPIVNLSLKESRLGGAANVALNLVALGAETFIASVVGNDKDGSEMIQLFEDEAINCSPIVRSESRKTTVKTRVLGNNQQLLRIDSEQTDDITSQEEDQLVQLIEKLVLENTVDAIIFEDYNKGVLTEKVIEKVIAIAKANHIITTVDPKKTNFFAYKGVTLFKPNLKELKEGLNRQFDIRHDLESFEKSVELLTERLHNQISLVTLSEFGVFIKDADQKHYLPAHVRNIADVSGAGDTVISVATLCLTAGIALENVAQISNISGGLVCEEVGVVSIDKEKLQKEIIKIIGEEIK